MYMKPSNSCIRNNRILAELPPIQQEKEVDGSFTSKVEEKKISDTSQNKELNGFEFRVAVNM